MPKVRPGPRLPALMAILALLAGAFACRREAPPETAPGRLTILYTGGIQGALEPCGCSPGQLGGIGRIATLIKEIRKETGPVILIDAGERLFEEADVGEAIAAQRILKAGFMQKAYGALGASVLNLGAQDLAGGSELAVQEAKGIGAAPLSANLFAQKGLRKSIAQGATVLEVGGVRVTFLGILDPASLSNAEKESFIAEDPAPRVRAIVEEFRPQADVVILLSTLSEKANEDLARRVPGIDVVIGAGVRGKPRNIVVPDREGNTLLVQVKPLGEFLGRIDVAPGQAEAGAPRFADATEDEKIQGLAREGAGATGGLRFDDALDLRGLPDRPDAKPRALLKPLPPVAPGSLRHTVYAVGDYLTQDPGIQRLMNEYKLKVADLNRSMPVPTDRLPTDGAAYTGDAACWSCHKSIADFVAGISHARAYATLEAKQSEYDLECVGCHVTGWKQPGGMDHPGAVGNLKNVQCEACHGPGSVHVAAGGARGVGKVKAEVALSLCRTCHTPEHSTRFAGNEEAYMDRIRCSQAVLADAAAKQEAGAGPAVAGEAAGERE